MDRISQYTAKIRQTVDNYFQRGDTPGILQLCGKSGMGKSTVARHCVKEFDCMYFSFRHMEAELAPRIFLPGCNTWRDFFSQIQKTKKRPVIFFDDVDDRNDKETFWEALEAFLNGSIYVVLMCRKELDLPYASQVLTIKAVTAQELLEEYPSLGYVNALRLTAITNGIPALLSQFDSSKGYEENLRMFFTPGSQYLRYAEDYLHREFRSPESYNTLLYGMAIGHNRISQLADFSGYPKNKCDKYLKALHSVGLIEQRQKRDDTGKIRTHYYPKGGYFKIWYRLYFPRQYFFHKRLSDEDLQQLIQAMDDCATSALFRQICFRWLKAKSYRLFSEDFLLPENPLQHDILLNGETLDFVQEGQSRTFYAKIWDSCTSGFPGYAFEKMEDATTRRRPFYDNEYALFSMRRVSAYCDKLRAFENVQVFELRTMWGNKKDHLFDMD